MTNLFTGGILYFTVVKFRIIVLLGFILTGFLERDWILITGLCYTPGAIASGLKVHDRPIRYFSGKFTMTSV